MPRPYPLLGLLLVLGGCATRAATGKISLADAYGTRQLLVVRTADWSATEGTLAYYQWEAGRWRPVLQAVPVMVGRKGLAWGPGLHAATLQEGTLKTEGDGKAPAGIFSISGAYGYHDVTTRLPYLRVDSTVWCVDDAASPYYNRLVDTDTLARTWSSAERMRRKDDLYKYGLLVAYNTERITKGAGSCIFFHVWRGAGRPTAGCTAMQEQVLTQLLSALDARQKPVLVQAPAPAYARLRAAYVLPEE
ncbi:L,D-transpeptidase family protein [Hymenobacter coalescens]